jgi:PIN domain nuclease of toxin-antitoxin system
MGKWEIQIKIREIQIKNPGNPNKYLGEQNKKSAKYKQKVGENQTKNN